MRMRLTISGTHDEVFQIKMKMTEGIWVSSNKRRREFATFKTGQTIG